MHELLITLYNHGQKFIPMFPWSLECLITSLVINQLEPAMAHIKAEDVYYLSIPPSLTSV